jgi:protein-tyrosine phosphatase
LDLIYTHPSGGKIYQCGAGQIPGTPDPWHYRWHKPGHHPDDVRQGIHDNILQALSGYQITTLVLAGEYQPILEGPELEVINTPFDDSFDMTPSTVSELLKAIKPIALQMAEKIVTGETLLSTCWAGKNRSSLLTGLALKKLRNPEGKLLMRGQEIIDLIRKKRSATCLCNPVFHDLVLHNTWEE